MGTRLQRTRWLARTLASPAMNVHPTRRSCRGSRYLLIQVLHTKLPRAFLQWDCAERHKKSDSARVQDQAVLACLLCRSSSTATGRGRQTLRAPCNSAVARSTACAVHSRSALLPPAPPHTPPAASRHLRHAPLPRTPLRPIAAQAPLPLRPTRSGSRALSPARPLGPHTPTVHPPNTAPRLPSGINALLLFCCTGAG